MAKSKGCTCLKQVKTELASHNATVEQRMQINFSTGKAGLSPPLVSLEKIDSKKRGSLPVAVCEFCPWCGKKYPE